VSCGIFSFSIAGYGSLHFEEKYILKASNGGGRLAQGNQGKTQIRRRKLLIGAAGAAISAVAAGYAFLSKAKTATDADIALYLSSDFRAVPFWWDELNTVPLDGADLIDNADFVVVGAGYSGLTAGRTLASYGGKVLVLDAKQPFYGASSRNCGFFGQVYEDGGDRSTPQKSAFFDECLASNRLLHRLMEEDGIDASMRMGRYKVFPDNNILKAFEFKSRLISSSHDFSYSILSSEEGNRFFKSGLANHGGIYYPQAPYLQPARLAHGNYMGALKKGCSIVGNTPVTDISRDAGGGFIVTTKRGNIRAGKVLVAVGGYGAPSFQALGDVLPVKSYLIATEPLTAAQMAQIWDTPVTLSYLKANFSLIIPSPDGKRLIVNGRTGERFASPEAVAVALCKLLQGIYPQLGPVRASHVWDGTFGMTWSFTKHIFKDEEGVFYLTGDNGSGIGKMHYLGHKVALQMLGQSEGRTVYASGGPPPLFPGYIAKSDWFMPGAVAYYDLRDRFMSSIW
jgi:glycine/D-amino acid oxidase-like deaminating enzyme